MCLVNGPLTLIQNSISLNRSEIEIKLKGSLLRKLVETPYLENKNTFIYSSSSYLCGLYPLGNNEKMKKAKKAIIIGFDGAIPGFVQRFRKQLPHLDALMKKVNEKIKENPNAYTNKVASEDIYLALREMDIWLNRKMEKYKMFGSRDMD